MLRKKTFNALISWLPLAAALSACAGNSEMFESGLKDTSLGKPLIADGKQPLSETKSDVNSASAFLDSYRLENLKPGKRPPNETDEGGLWLVADLEERKNRLAGNLITDEKLNSYVRSVLCRLTGPYCAEIRLYIQRVPVFNAFMTPNGQMVVWSGLLLRARNESEMAAVLGHEFGHYLRRHSLQRQRDTIAKSNFMAFAGIALSLGGAPAGSVELMQIMTRTSILAFGRDHEREADGYGLRVLYDSNYDLHSAGAMWGLVQKEEKAAGKEEIYNPFTFTHPSSAEREAELNKLADMLAKKQGKNELGRERYLEHILPWRAAFLEDEISRKPQKQALALIDLLIEDGVRLGELYFFKGEVHRRSNQKEGPEEALKLYKKAIEHEGAPPEVYRSMALAHLAQNQKELSKSDFETYLARAPQASDAKLILMQIEAMK
ncbi:MAG: hypothetical protein EPN26_03865 [Rhodospirillales bacterium]|nr:MAG: hypothetical protein EPN26_03865 [Rhodospirillales bacterium]